MSTLFDGYAAEAFFDEVVDAEGEVRLHYRGLVKALSELTPNELRRREELRDDAFRDQGITFVVYSR